MYSAHDGIHMPPVISYILGMMSSTEWCDDIYSGYDVTYILDVISYI